MDDHTTLLEREVEVLRRLLGRSPEGASDSAASQARPPFSDDRVGRESSGGVRPTSRAFSARDILENAEIWLPRVGIGLVLFAVAFAFKYSIDQGWVIPAVRVAFGYALGLTLLVLGFKLSGVAPIEWTPNLLREKGVHSAKNETTVRAGVPASNG